MPERRTTKRSSARQPARTARSKAPARKRPTTPVPRPRRARPGGDRSFLWRRRRGLFMVGLVCVASLGGVTAVVFNTTLPPEESLLQTSFVCAADVAEACGPENAIATFSAEEDRTNVQLEDVPEVLQQAVLATEDRDYYEHGGIDPVGIGRALYQDLRGTGATQGGSTITQQYVKNVYLSSERSIVRKVKEAVLAVKLERELSKDEILERYLNTIYFGRGAYGVDAASRAYYGKDVEDIGLPRGVLPGRPHPLARGRRRPRATPRRPTRRRHTVLARDGVGGLHHHRGARLRRRRHRSRPAWSSSGTGRAWAGSRATPPTTTSAPSTSSRRCGGRSPTSTARTSSTAAACGSTPRSTSTCSAPRGTR